MRSLHDWVRYLKSKTGMSEQVIHLDIMGRYRINKQQLIRLLSQNMRGNDWRIQRAIAKEMRKSKEFWACFSKPSYKRREDAEMAMRAVAGGSDLHPYECHFCGMWHKGH